MLHVVMSFTEPKSYPHWVESKLQAFAGSDNQRQQAAGNIIINARRDGIEGMCKSYVNIL